MGAPLSMDLRKRIISGHERGESVDQIVERLEVSQNAVYSLIRLYKETGDIKPRENKNGRKSKLNDEDLINIQSAIEEQPDLTLVEIKEKLRLPICISALCRIIKKKLNMTFKKKTIHAQEQKNEDISAERDEWMDDQEFMDPSSLVFIDECSVNTGMTRLYGRAEKGERVIDHAPEKNEAQTIVSSVRLDGETVPLVLDKALNGEAFKVFVEECLIPTLRDGDVVVMDNLSSHKVKGIKELIEEGSVKARLKYLPRYSPELNPIEEMWSKLKGHLKKVKARTLDVLLDAISEGLDLVSQNDLKGWFEHCGYSIPQQQ